MQQANHAPGAFRPLALCAALAVTSALGGAASRSLAQPPSAPAAVPAVAAPAAGDRGEAPPLFDGMGTHRRRITTSSAEAQRYFDQALVWAYAFNHDEAIRSFEHAARLDPACAMAWWGAALCHGPHINNPAMDRARSTAAWDALAKARALVAGASPVERRLIEALAARYADPAAGSLPLTFEERAPLDRAYAAAMKAVYDTYPDDTDVATLYAEALMDLRPWDLWDGATGEPRPETPEVVAVLERVLAADPDHPGANHLYVHAVEASRRPERAVGAADRLRRLVPASGHLVHMPAHIDVRTGRWDQAAEQNRQAAAIDAAYRARSPHQEFYRLYMAHNHHFLAYACMMLGRRDEAIDAARAMIAAVPAEWARENAALIDGYYPIEIEALLRFGQWDRLLAMEHPPEFLPITTALWRYARAASLGALGRLDEADAERERFRAAVAGVPAGAMMAINPASTVLAIAGHVLDGELAFRRGDTDGAVRHLREAVRIEDTLRYMEPPDWVQPARHSLGAVLLAAGRVDDAEKVYREDLARWPGNGWSLYGLWQCLERRGDAGAAEAEARFKEAWRHADTRLHATCLCIPKEE
jgi:tetratricopeptide (TPR) repeat protein